MLKARMLIGILVLMITGGMPAYTWGDTIPPAVTPSVAGGTYTSSQRVKLTANESALIYYTTNGSDPTTASSVYTTPIIVNTSLTLKYFAVDGAGNASSIQTQTYVIAGGDVRAWGDNQYGQLGDGTFVDSSIPLQAGGFVDVVEVSGGAFHTIILRKDGTVWAWGGNNAGQLGDGTTIDSPVPVQVSGLANVVAIDGGISHSIALKNDGTVWTWGLNNFGQLGDGTQIDSTVPVQVSGLTGMVGIAGGRHHSIALKNDGTVWTWGRNKEGQLGNGTSLDYILLPVGVTGLTNIVAVAAGDFHSLSVSNDRTVWAWGRNNNGELGDGTTINRTTPVNVSGLSNVVAAIAGANPHSLALKGDGTVWAWGRNSEGQLGNGTTIDSLVPLQVNGLANGAAIAAGVYHSIALMNDGTVWTWGSNVNGELGDGTFINSPVPVPAGGASYISAIAGGGYHTIAIRQDTVPPTGSVMINGDATATNSASVNLALSCADTGTGCAQMQFSNDDITWSEWEPYASTKAWIMATGDGGKAVYVQLRDVIGNVSESYMDAIILDTTPPRTTASPAAGGFPGPLTVTLTTDEPATIYYTTDGSAPSTVSSIYSAPISITENTTLKYFAVDSLGNQESVKTGSYGINVIDLIVSSLSAPSSIYTGVSYTVSNTVKNIGNISSTTSYLKFYLSTDANIDSSDLYLTQRSVGSLSWGASNSANTTIKLPVTLSPGTYYIGAIADANSTNTEFDETNNTASTTAITVQSGIDFVISSLSAPSTIYTGVNVTISNTVKNLGVGASATSYLKFYLSTDNNIDASDLYLTQRSVSSLNGGVSSSASTTIKLPVTLEPGTYYIGAIADETNTNVEGDETNNKAVSGAVTVLSGVDLVVSAFSVPSTITTGLNATIDNTVTNNSIGASATSYLKIYLSTDANIDSSDLYLTQRSVSSLNGGVSSSASTTIKLPVTLEPGTYYIGAIADATYTNVELDETNNTATTAPVIITSP